MNGRYPTPKEKLEKEMTINASRTIFSRVKIARELLRERAEEILDNYLDTVQKAKDAGDFETAAKSLQWLMDHMPAEDDGTRVVETSVDKQQQIVQQDTSPRIQIGISVGGSAPKQISIAKPRELPKAEIIDAE